jgi:hypothetical protein
MAPSGAKTFGAEFPNAGTRLTGVIGSAAKAALAPKSINIAITNRLTGCPVKKVAFMSFGAQHEKVSLPSAVPYETISLAINRKLLKAPCWRQLIARFASHQR